MGQSVGYARVSTEDQDPALQHQALTDVGCDRVYTEKASGALRERPQLNAMLDYLRAGDVLVVWKLDRLGRSLKDLVEIVSDLGKRGIGFRSLTEGFDTTTPGGKLIFHVMAALAEFERDIIRERTLAGLAQARANGRVGGRRPKLVGPSLETAREMVASERYTMQQIADTLGCSRATLYRALDEAARA